MTTTKTADVDGTLAQIYALAAAGADIVRCTCNEEAAAEGLAHIVPRSPVPIVADIHFHHEMALAALEAGVQGLRLNPGNLRKEAEIKQVAAEAADRGVPIRIGVNAGSLHPDLYKQLRRGDPRGAGRVGPHRAGLLRGGRLRRRQDLGQGLVGGAMIAAYRLASETFDHPLHLGVTEAGPPPAGLVKGTAGIGTLLAEGIGDTIRFSLTADPVEEARAGRQLLEALGLRERKGLDLIACPSCGRAQVDVIAVAKEAQEALEKLQPAHPGRRHGLRGQRPRRGARGRPRHRGRQAEGPPLHPGQDRPRRPRGRDGRRPRRGSRAAGGRRASRRAWPRPTRAPRPRRRPTGEPLLESTRRRPEPHRGEDRDHPASRRGRRPAELRRSTAACDASTLHR